MKRGHNGIMRHAIVAIALALNLIMSFSRLRVSSQCAQYGYPHWARSHGTAFCIKADESGAYVAEPLADVLVDVRERMEGR